MATATRKIRTVTKTEEIRDGATLRLSEDEARTLTVILSRVGGTYPSPRGYAAAIIDALMDAGFRWTSAPEELLAQGSVYFDIYEEVA